MSAVLGLGDVARDQGDPVGNRQYSEPSLTFFLDLGIKWAFGFALNNIAQAACIEGDFTQPVRLLMTAMPVSRPQGRRRTRRSSYH
jgi:hypothetical protein